jgi:hypothetical protein
MAFRHRNLMTCVATCRQEANNADRQKGECYGDPAPAHRLPPIRITMSAIGEFGARVNSIEALSRWPSVAANASALSALSVTRIALLLISRRRISVAADKEAATIAPAAEGRTAVGLGSGNASCSVLSARIASSRAVFADRAIDSADVSRASHANRATSVSETAPASNN